MDSVRFITFGCKANQYDTQVLREALLRRGLQERDRAADLVVVNTCTVTAEAGRKARQVIRRLAREEPGTRIAVTGCLAEAEGELLRELPGVEWVLGNGDAKQPVQFLRELGHEATPEELGIPSGITEFSGHTRAFLKIQDGCNMACAFCIIPKVRGASRSRTIAELSAEVSRLVLAGHVEIVLCGIHIGHWGLDLHLTLADLIESLCALEVRDEEGQLHPFRLRLSSIEATEVDDRLLGLMAGEPLRLAAHLHMPMQSGSDKVLKAMNRWYDRATYLEACHKIRSRLKKPAFTADVLVGFPGEDEKEFEQTLAAVREAGFARLHVFPFSARPMTAAWNMEGLPPVAAVRERRARLSDAAAELAGAYTRSLAGLRETIILEGFSGLSGRYQRVRVRPEEVQGLPTWVEVRLALDEEGGLLGREPRTLAERPLAAVLG